MILARYILREHVAPFLFGLSLIALIFTMNLLFQMLGRIAGKGIPLGVVLEYFALNLAWIIALAVPMSVLIACLSAFGRLSADGEITALRATGISPTRLMRPVLWASLVVAIGIGLFNNLLLPDLNHRNKLLMIDISRKKPTLNIEPSIYAFAIPKYVLLAGEVDQSTGSLKQVTIYDEHQAGQRSTIVSRSGQIKFVPEEEKILLTLYDGEIHQPLNREPNGYEWTDFDSALFRVPAPGMLLKRGTSGYRGDRELSAGEMLGRVRELEMKGGPHNQRRIAAFLVEIHKKFSIPAACLVFVLLGTPLGIMAHKGGLGVSGGISLLFFTIYWAFLAAGEDLADRGLVSPAAAMWSPNVFLAVIGVWLLWMAKRRTSLPAVGWVGERLRRLLRFQEGRSSAGG